jgi:hypothetical protein
VNDYSLRRVCAAARGAILLLAALTPLALWAGCNKEAQNQPPKPNPTVKKTPAAPTAGQDGTHGGGTPPERPVGHDQGISGAPPTQSPADTGEKIDLTGIAKAEGGHTVAELFAGKDALNGKQVKVRGKVVKYFAGIMGKNWIHLQDGTGDAKAKTNDLLVTTKAETQLGALILVSGRLTADKNFGFYRFAATIENATIEPQAK